MKSDTKHDEYKKITCGEHVKNSLNQVLVHLSICLDCLRLRKKIHGEKKKFSEKHIVAQMLVKQSVGNNSQGFTFFHGSLQQLQKNRWQREPAPITAQVVTHCRETKTVNKGNQMQNQEPWKKHKHRGDVFAWKLTFIFVRKSHIKLVSLVVRITHYKVLISYKWFYWRNHLSFIYLYTL